MKEKLAAEILKSTENVIAENLTGDYKFYATRKVEAARRAGTLEAAIKASDDVVMIVEKLID